MPTTTRYTYHYDSPRVSTTAVSDNALATGHPNNQQHHLNKGGPPTTAAGLGGRGSGYASRYACAQMSGGGPPALRSSLNVSAHNSAFVGDVRKVPPPTMRATRADDGWAAAHPNPQRKGANIIEAAYTFAERERWPHNEAASGEYIDNDDDDDDDDDSEDLGATPAYPPSPPLRGPTDHYMYTTPPIPLTEDAYSNHYTNNNSIPNTNTTTSFFFPPSSNEDAYSSGGGEGGGIGIGIGIGIGMVGGVYDSGDTHEYYCDDGTAAAGGDSCGSTSPYHRYTPRGVYDNHNYDYGEEEEGIAAGHQVVYNNNSISNNCQQYSYAPAHHGGHGTVTTRYPAIHAPPHPSATMRGRGDVHGEPHDALYSHMYTHSDLNEGDYEEEVAAAVMPIYSPSMAPYEEDREILRRERGALLHVQASNGSVGNRTRDFDLPLLHPHHEPLTTHNMLYSSYNHPYPYPYSHHHEHQRPTGDAIQLNSGLNDTAPLARTTANNTANLLNSSEAYPNPYLLSNPRLHPRHSTASAVVGSRPIRPSLDVSGGALTGSSWLTREAAVASTLDAYADFFTTRVPRAEAPPFPHTTREGAHLVGYDETDAEYKEEEEEVEIEHIHIHHVHHICESGDSGKGIHGRQQPAIRSSSSSSSPRIARTHSITMSQSQKRNEQSPSNVTLVTNTKPGRREGAAHAIPENKERSDSNEIKGFLGASRRPNTCMPEEDGLVVSVESRQVEGQERSTIKGIPDHRNSPQKAIYTVSSEGSLVSASLPPLVLVEYADPNFLPVVVAPLPITQHEHLHRGVLDPNGGASGDEEGQKRRSEGKSQSNQVEDRPPLPHQPSPSSVHITPAHLEHTMRFEHTTDDSGPPQSTDDSHLIPTEDATQKVKDNPRGRAGRASHGNDLSNSTLYNHIQHHHPTCMPTEGRSYKDNDTDVCGKPKSNDVKDEERRRRSLTQEKGAEERLLDQLEALIGQSKTYRNAVREVKGVGREPTGDGTVASTRSSSTAAVNCSNISAIQQQSSRHLQDTSISAPDTPLRSRSASTQSLGTLSKQPLGGANHKDTSSHSAVHNIRADSHDTRVTSSLGQGHTYSSVPSEGHSVPLRLRSRHLLLMSPYGSGREEEEETHTKMRPTVDEDYFDVTNLGDDRDHSITNDAHTKGKSSSLLAPPQYWYDPPLSRYVTIPDLMYERASSRAASSSVGALHMSRGTSRSHSACHSVHGEHTHNNVRSISNSNSNSYHSGKGRRRLLSPQLPRRGGEVIVVISNAQEGKSSEDERDRHDRTATASVRPPLALRSAGVGTHEKSSNEAEVLEKKSTDLLHNINSSLGGASWTTPSPRRRRGSGRGGTNDLSALITTDDPRFSPEQERLLDKRRDNTEDAVSRVLEMFGTNDVGMDMGMTRGVDLSEPPTGDLSSATPHPMLMRAGSGASPSPPRSLYRRRFAVRL